MGLDAYSSGDTGSANCFFTELLDRIKIHYTNQLL